MIIVLKPNQKQEIVNELVEKLTNAYDVQVNTWVGTHSTNNIQNNKIKNKKKNIL